MCGLFGFDLSRYQLPLERRVALAAVLATGNDNRGGDSWGWFSPGRGTARGLGDIAGQTSKFFNSPILMAHTRKATIGAITKENSHPFDIGNIIGAHNGMITNHEELNRLYERQCQVDSMHIFHHINESRGLEDINGYGAISFIRKDEGLNKVYLVKLSAGDLAVYGIGKDPDNCKGVIWSSDEDHLKAALTAANINAFPYQVDSGEVC